MPKNIRVTKRDRKSIEINMYDILYKWISSSSLEIAPRNK
jgi:hypothetical protein